MRSSDLHETVTDQPRPLDAGVPAPQGMPAQLARIADLCSMITATPAEPAIWSTLMADGLAVFAGCQIRHLIGSAHGWLGAVGFPAAALRVKAPDHWMAWDDEQRRAHLGCIVCLNRFLIRPMVRCAHLTWPVIFRGGYCGVCQRTVKRVIRPYLFSWKPMRMMKHTTGPVCGRPTLCGWEKQRGVVLKTANACGSGAQGRSTCMHWTPGGGIDLGCLWSIMHRFWHSVRVENQ